MSVNSQKILVPEVVNLRNLEDRSSGRIIKLLLAGKRVASLLHSRLPMMPESAESS
jgi:hypothetical protein